MRTEPLLLAEGRLEKLPIAGGAINIMVHSIGSLDAPTSEQGAVIDLAERAAAAAPLEEAEEQAGAGGEGEERVAAAGGGAGLADFRGVAPPVLSFAAGRRR